MNNEIQRPENTFTVDRHVRAYELAKGVKEGKGFMAVIGSEFLTPDEADALADSVKAYAQWLRTASSDELRKGDVTFVH